MRRVLLLMPTTTYKATDFLAAARRLQVEVVIGSERRQALEGHAPGRTLAVDLFDAERGLMQIEAFASRFPLAAVLGADDETVELAARAADRLDLPHNPVAAVHASRDKAEARERFAAAGLRTPAFRTFPVDGDETRAAEAVSYPCVLKPRFLSAGRGVLRADDPAAFAAAFRRIRRLLERPELQRRGGTTAGSILVEEYIDGDELALEGLLHHGRLRRLALFDKPDPLEGPTFEETVYVTPSRQTADVQRAVDEETAAACAALGLTDGPVHAELRVDGGRPWVLEVAARTIGGLCARTLRFGTGVSLEELVLRHVLGLDTTALERDEAAAGVMMIPVPAAGILRGIRGLEAARAVAGVEEVTLTMHRGDEVVPLPEGNRYLGFIFARGEEADTVDRALRAAHARLDFDIESAQRDRDRKRPGRGNDVSSSTGTKP